MFFVEGGRFGLDGLNCEGCDGRSEGKGLYVSSENGYELLGDNGLLYDCRACARAGSN